ncbi:MAG: penicillin-binding protein 1A [Rickettsiales bacterium]|jgi:penicillin-binding protein 1A
MSKIIKFGATCFFILMLFGVSSGVYIIKKYSKGLPSYEQLKSYSPSITTRLYASDGKLLTEYSKEKRIFVPISSIPKHLINAFLAAEDSNFYHHSGIDFLAIIRAAINNIFSIINSEGLSGGGSTITQQVVKNFLLTNERTFQRKIKEAILAYRMTENFSKDEVLELYLNQIYLGSGSYGVAAAAQIYFDKAIEDLSIGETALLATLPKAPSKLDPRKNIKKAKIRRDWVIGRMVKEGFISKEDGKMEIEKPIILVERSDGEVFKAEFFADAVKKELTNLYGSDNVFESGIVVRTTIDPELQEYAAKSLQNGIEKYDMKHGWRGVMGKYKDIESLSKEVALEKDPAWLGELESFQIRKLYKNSWQKSVILSVAKDFANLGIEDGSLGTISLSDITWARKYIDADTKGGRIEIIEDVLNVGDIILVEKTKTEGKYSLRQIPEVNGAFLAMDPHNGRVLAMMGGYVDAVNQFNRSTQAQRQPGSIVKTFGYITALENGLTPASIIIDEEVSYDQGEDLELYEPRNYSGKFYGPVTLRFGLENSINVTTIRMADQVGLEKVSEMIDRFGIAKRPKAIYSSVLGSLETNLIKVVSAYAAIVNGGKKVDPAIIEKIQNRNGKTIYKRDSRDCEDCFVSDENSIVLPDLYDDRERLIDPVTSYQITSMLEGVVQRGTSRRAKAVRKVLGGKTGTTNNSIDSWFVGFSPDLVVGVYMGFDIPKTLGKYESGSSAALPIFVDFMKKALKNKPSTPFRVPNGVKFVKIDRKTGASPIPETPKVDIIFEAFKLDDVVEEDSRIVPTKNYQDEEGAVGIY